MKIIGFIIKYLMVYPAFAFILSVVLTGFVASVSTLFITLTVNGTLMHSIFTFNFVLCYIVVSKIPN